MASPVSWAFSQLVAGSEGEHLRDGELNRSYQLFCDPASDSHKASLCPRPVGWSSNEATLRFKGREHRPILSAEGVSVTLYQEPVGCMYIP